jgi:hypothetical protein
LQAATAAAICVAHARSVTTRAAHDVAELAFACDGAVEAYQTAARGIARDHAHGPGIAAAAHRRAAAAATATCVHGSELSAALEVCGWNRRPARLSARSACASRTAATAVATVPSVPPVPTVATVRDHRVRSVVCVRAVVVISASAEADQASQCTHRETNTGPYSSHRLIVAVDRCAKRAAWAGCAPHRSYNAAQSGGAAQGPA